MFSYVYFLLNIYVKIIWANHFLTNYSIYFIYVYTDLRAILARST